MLPVMVHKHTLRCKNQDAQMAAEYAAFSLGEVACCWRGGVLIIALQEFLKT